MEASTPGAPTPQDPTAPPETTAPPAAQDPAAASPTAPPPAPGQSAPPPSTGSPADVVAAQADPPAPPQPDPAPNEPAPVDVAAELAAMRAKIAELEQSQHSAYQGLSSTDQELADKVDQLRADFDKWPQKGDQYADAPQPWDLQAHGLPQPGVTRDHLPGGQPDPISPVVVAHRYPLLTAGSAGDAVVELADLLAKVGYSTSISEGRNHAAAFDDTITSAVNTFKRDYHVQEDPSQFRDDQEAQRYVGPWTWEALIRAARLTEND